MAEEKKSETKKFDSYGSVKCMQEFRTYGEEVATGIFDMKAVYRSMLDNVDKGNVRKENQPDYIDALGNNCERMFTENHWSDNKFLSKCFIERILMSPITVPLNFITSTQDKVGEGLRNNVLNVIRLPFDVANFWLSNANTNSYSIAKSDRSLEHPQGPSLIILLSIPLSYPAGLVLTGAKMIPPVQNFFSKLREDFTNANHPEQTPKAWLIETTDANQLTAEEMKNTLKNLESDDYKNAAKNKLQDKAKESQARVVNINNDNEKPDSNTSPTNRM